MAETKTPPILFFPDDTEGKRERSLLKDSVIIGRDESCDIVVAQRQVSRQHVKVYRDGGAYFVQDLESRNGTWVNKEKLEGARRLNDGDEVMLANVARFQYYGSGATAPMDTVPPHIIGGRLRIDRDTRQVYINNIEIDPPLSPPQYRLLELLYSSGGRICTREMVVEAVWPEVVSDGVSEQAIDALVRRLRDRLAEIDPEWQYVITVRGHGFRLEQG